MPEYLKGKENVMIPIGFHLMEYIPVDSGKVPGKLHAKGFRREGRENQGVAKESVLVDLVVDGGNEPVLGDDQVVSDRP